MHNSATQPNSKTPRYTRLPQVIPTAVVIFGASGDLTNRKLAPALFNLALDQLLPKDFALIGFSRKNIEPSAFRTMVSESIQKYSRRPFSSRIWKLLEHQIDFQCGNYDDPLPFVALKQKLDTFAATLSTPLQYLFYLATPPSAFGPIVENLGKCGLNCHNHKIILEKPFGYDLKSAKALNIAILRQFSEKQIYRIDHYLGKETVQDLLVQRFANAILEPIWNYKYIEYVEITVAESLGMEGRGKYYDTSGTLRDMIQNHALQLLSLIAMEPPISLKAEDIRAEKIKLLRAIQSIEPKKEAGQVVRARYTEGTIQGMPVCGYLQEPGIAANSMTETYIALKLFIDNWRWGGVPFYMRSGKRLKQRISEIVIHFKAPPNYLFGGTGGRKELTPNSMIIQIQPNGGMTLQVNSKVPGLETRVQPANLHFRYASVYGSNTPEAYERLVLDAMSGDQTLFIRGDEAEICWELCAPLLEYWETIGKEDIEEYPAGSWGPKGTKRLFKGTKHAWRKVELG